MASRLNFVADRTVKGRMYPALSRHEARPLTQAWREFGQHWPYTTPIRLEEYCTQHKIDFKIFSPQDELPTNSWYPIGLAFFDFGIDYIALLPFKVKQRLITNDFKLLFYYHEGDNPAKIKQRLDELCAYHGLASEIYHFISANTAASRLPRFWVFHDFELWYHQRNAQHRACRAHPAPRTKDFTALCRTHKTWRASIMSMLLDQGLLDCSYWSYGQALEPDLRHDNAIEIDLVPGVAAALERFAPPYACDHLSQQDHNDHSHLVREHFENSYCNIVLESQFDVDQSQGVFITEKTFKPIKHGQLFFVAGAAGTLQTLRTMGYRVFDSALDNRYDEIRNHTQRYEALLQAICKARAQGLHALYQLCLPDILHNQKLFHSAPYRRLNSLVELLNEDR